MIQFFSLLVCTEFLYRNPQQTTCITAVSTEFLKCKWQRSVNTNQYLDKNFVIFVTFLVKKGIPRMQSTVGYEPNNGSKAISRKLDGI